jgi:Dyp-type peroxidase family
MPNFDLANIQGNVLRAYTHPVATFVFLHTDDASRGRAWLADLISRVTTADPWVRKPASTLNVSFSWSGLRALGCDAALLDSFPAAFREGPAARAQLVGDVSSSAPETWEDGFGSGAIHAMVSLYGLDGAALAAAEAWLAGLSERHGMRAVARQSAGRLPGGVEHFGYVDGTGQPEIEARGVESDPGGGSPEPDGTWRDIRAGEFLLGHRDEEGILPAAPKPHDLGRDGTYLVYRKLRQDVAGYRAFLSQHGQRLPGGAEALAAKIVGRWRDGTPLHLSPGGPDPVLAGDAKRNNAFRYAEDRQGYRCPIGSHIRRANPRDSLPFGAKLVNRHRMIRRGVPYGDPLPEGAADDGQDRGLIFMCLQADLVRQFEFVQSQWLNDGNIFRLGADRDPLLGGAGKMTIQGAPPRFLHPLPPVVTTRAGEYFFLPGLAALRFLSNGA